jgi:hypothetical protein
MAAQSSVGYAETVAIASAKTTSTVPTSFNKFRKFKR